MRRIAAAPSLTKNQTETREPEMDFTNRRYRHGGRIDVAEHARNRTKSAGGRRSSTRSG
jgi:hypothetical protein